MLLTFSRHQIMYNVSNVVLCAEVTYRAYFVVIKESKLKHWTITLRILRFILHYRVSKHNSYSFLLNLSTLLCCIDFEISPSLVEIKERGMG